MPIVALALACSVNAQAEEIGTGRGMKTDIVSESESLKLEQAKPHYKSQENSASLPAGSENFMTVKNLAEFEISGLQMASGEGQLMEVSYSAVSAVIPESYYLSAYYRNPSNPETKAGFHLHRTARVELSVYNLLGQWVNTLAEGELSQVEHFVSWDGRNYQGNRQPSGVYFCRIDSELGSIKRKMVLVN
ncbi:MAG: T9SS type A sorting domain-containing protein [candidate division Zixibacteria bacterium]|nr:T9SS type A sorting domain-containing protein [candidate division Zixibacteria bacterium]